MKGITIEQIINLKNAGFTVEEIERIAVAYEHPQEQPKEQPKEQPQEQPQGHPKEQPKEQPKEIEYENPHEHVDPYDARFSAIEHGIDKIMAMVTGSNVRRTGVENLPGDNSVEDVVMNYINGGAHNGK